MDDQLEQPSYLQKSLSAEERADEGGSSDEEDEGPDWTKLPSIARPIIPKRGDKDFEPSIHGGSGLQKHVLDRSRSAMLEALKATRTTSIKSISYAVWYPTIARAHVTTARGTHFASMGHSVPRDAGSVNHSQDKVGKRLELLPEEALYLIERGTMFCWKATEHALAEDMEGEPMTVQQAFTEMIGSENLNLEKYQVYAYLRRLGYIVMRTKPPSPAYPLAAPFACMSPLAVGFSNVSVFPRLFSRLLCSVQTLLVHFASTEFDWWRPIQLHHNLTYTSLFSALRFLPYGYKPSLNLSRPPDKSPYQIFFNLYKPNTSFKKTAPPEPDFSIVVVNARTTPMPSLAELSSLFSEVPYLPPPVPRRRTPFMPSGAAKSAPVKPEPSTIPAAAPLKKQTGILQRFLNLVRRLFPFLFGHEPEQAAATSLVVRRVNPFAVLKAGKKMVVIAAVDAGSISFFRFGQGAFEDFPMN